LKARKRENKSGIEKLPAVAAHELLHKMSPNLAKELQTSKMSLWTLRVATNHTEVAQILSVNVQEFCR